MPNRYDDHNNEEWLKRQLLRGQEHRDERARYRRLWIAIWVLIVILLALASAFVYYATEGM